jgi:hypothetical protein
MRFALVALFAACAGAPAPVVTAPVDPPQAPPSKEEITLKSHELLDAFDRGDLAKLEPLLAARLVHFEGGKPRTRDDDLGAIRR